MTSEPKKRARRYDVDWLRVIAVCVLVLFHTAAIFNPYDGLRLIKGETIKTLAVGSAFIHEWRLSILFIVSGAGSYFALRSLSGARFARGRVKRLVIPLVMGTLLLVPVHHYFGLLYRNAGEGPSYPQFYAKLVGDFFTRGIFGRGPESLHWAHLWFLAYLFAASLVALPLFLYLRGDAGRRLVGRLAELLSRRGVIFLLALPLVSYEAILRPAWPWTRLLLVDDPAGFLFFTTLFVYGFVIFSDDRVTAAIVRHRKAALVLGLLTSVAFLTLYFSGRIPVAKYNLRWMSYVLLRGCNAWFWCVTVLGYGAKHLNFNHRLLPYANDAVYPVYVLHLPIMTVLAYFVVGTGLWAPAQFVVITLGTLAAAVCLYEFVIRRTKVTAVLFGVKPREPRRAGDLPLAPEAVAAAPTAD